MDEAKLIEKLLSHTDKRGPDECWEWRGSRTSQGYGGLQWKPWVAAHRFTYELVNGPIPDGLFVCHSCNNTACLNPKHLWLGTATDCARDKVIKGRHPRKGPQGERHASAKVTEDDVINMRRLYSTGEAGTWKLGKRFGITQQSVQAIVSGRHWKHVPYMPPRSVAPKKSSAEWRDFFGVGGAHG